MFEVTGIDTVPVRDPFRDPSQQKSSGQLTSRHRPEIRVGEGIELDRNLHPQRGLHGRERAQLEAG